MVLALVSKGESFVNDADAQVDITLTEDTTVDAAREQLISDATGSWQATRVAESSESADEATVEFALPGASLDGFVSALRRQPDAQSVEVSLEVDPEQVQPGSLAENTSPAGSSESEAATPAPVRVQVNLSSAGSQGPLVTFIGALLVAVVAAGGLALVWRHFGRDEGRPAAAESPDGYRSRGDGSSRRWTNRP